MAKYGVFTKTVKIDKIIVKKKQFVMAVILTKLSQSKLFLLCQNISWVGVVIKTAHENIFFILKAL